MIKHKYSKPLIPHKLQASQVADLKDYQQKMKYQAERYRAKATTTVDICPNCSHKKSSLLLEVYGYQYRQCSYCTHVYLHKHLSANDLKKYYSESSQYAATYTDLDQLEYRLNHIAKPKVAFVMKQLTNVKGGKWLDIGSAIGDILYSVEQYAGWKATGLEISNDSVKLGKKTWGVNLKQQLFREYYKTSPKNHFEVVSAFGYLGLIEDPFLELQRMSEVIKDKGYLVVGDSCADSFSTTLQQSYPELSLRHLIPPNILNCFTSKSLDWSLKELGFKQVAVWKFGLDFFEFLKYLCLLQDGFQDSPIYTYMVENANQFQHVIDKNKDSDYQIVVAQKTGNLKLLK